jgi:CBS domain-containing protein
MQNHGVRRVPVVNGPGSLQGLLSADDVIELLAEAMNMLTDLVKREMSVEEKQHSS